MSSENSSYTKPTVRTLDADALIEAMGPAVAGSASAVDPTPPLPPAGARH